LGKKKGRRVVFGDSVISQQNVMLELVSTPLLLSNLAEQIGHLAYWVPKQVLNDIGI